MKKTICFAGFAEGELPALREAATASNAPWECHFVADAPAALALLAKQPFDVLVANMAMPGKTGAELLREARESRPDSEAHANILGFIIGDVADQAVIINSIGGPHQFIRRPIQPARLVLNLKRGLSLDTWLATDHLRKLVPKLRRLPSLPSTYFNLLKEIESDNFTTQSIGAVISRDPVVTVRLLQMVNSAAFALAHKVTDPVDAVSLLGIETVKSLVMGLQVFSQSDAAREAGLSLEILWEHSLLVAKFAQQITLKQTGDVRLAGDAFTAGLLHDVGRIVIASNLPKEYAAIIARARENSRPLHEEEAATLQVDHAEVGAYLLGLWGLPVEIVEATGGHHAPGQTAFASEFTLLGAVHAANVFAHETGGQTDGLCLPNLDLEYFKTIQLENELAGWRECCTGEKPPASASDTEGVERSAVSTKNEWQPLPEPTTTVVYGWIAAVAILLFIVGVIAWRFYGR
jgi:HD-like signal output (HDOD) protein